MTNYKEKYEALKDDNLFTDREAEEAFKFVAEVIGLAIERTTELEPYATVAIAKMEAMESEIYHFLDNFLEELEEDE